MTAWERHHPPLDHPDFDAYFDTLTDDDLAAVTASTNAAATFKTRHSGLTDQDDLPDF